MSTNQPVPDETEDQQFLEQLKPYIQRYAKYVVNFPNANAHPTYMKRAGKRLRTIRRDAGLSRDFVAAELGVEPVLLAAFESGLVPPSDLTEGFEYQLFTFLRDAKRPSTK